LSEIRLIRELQLGGTPTPVPA